MATPGAPPPADPIVEFEERRKMGLIEMITDVDKKHNVAHGRLRQTTDLLENSVASLASDLKAISRDLKLLADAPVEASKLRFSTQALVVLSTVTATLVGTFYFATSGSAATLKSDLRDLVTIQKAKGELDVAYAKLQDERYVGLAKAVERLEQGRLTDKAEAARLLQKYDNEALARNLQQQGAKK